MILMEALEKYGLGDSTSLLENFSISQWGTVIHFYCLFDPYMRSPYEIRLTECHKVEWQVHSPEESGEDLLSIVDIQIKPIENDRYQFIMMSEVFELVVICKNVDVSVSIDK